jgi:hypothetical protein
MAHRWCGYWKHCYQCLPGTTSFSEAHFELIKSHSAEYSRLMGELVEAGVEVHVATIHLDDDRFDPRNMYNDLGVIEENILPWKLS